MAISFRLPTLLKAEQEKNQLTVAQLCDLIEAADPEGTRLDRRKLTRLLAGDSVALYPREYEALDAFLAPLGEGLAERPLFDRATILHGVASCASRLFVVGARPRDSRQDIAFWDMQALFELVNHLQQLRLSHVELITSLGHPRKTKAELQKFANRRDMSVCCAGSPRSCPISEHVLARLFGVAPHAPRKAGKLPFQFWWGNSPDEKRRSSFESLEPPPGLAGETPSEEAAFWWRDGWRTGSSGGSQFDYGIVAAQRQPGESVWVVVAGVSGPGTYAAAKKLIDETVSSLPRAKKGRKAVTAFAGVRARVTTRSGASDGDPRSVGKVELLNDRFLFWNPNTHQLEPS